jgi:hypothetical protein
MQIPDYQSLMLPVLTAAEHREEVRFAEMHPLRFFGWVLLLSIPFYAWGVFWPIEALPFGLPVSVAMIIVPALVATVMTRREQGRRAVYASFQVC